MLINFIKASLIGIIYLAYCILTTKMRHQRPQLSNLSILWTSLHRLYRATQCLHRWRIVDRFLSSLHENYASISIMFQKKISWSYVTIACSSNAHKRARMIIWRVIILTKLKTVVLITHTIGALQNRNDGTIRLFDFVETILIESQSSFLGTLYVACYRPRSDIPAMPTDKLNNNFSVFLTNRLVLYYKFKLESFLNQHLLFS